VLRANDIRKDAVGKCAPASAVAQRPGTVPDARPAIEKCRPALADNGGTEAEGRSGVQRHTSVTTALPPRWKRRKSNTSGNCVATAGPARREPRLSATRFRTGHREQVPGQEQLADLACPVVDARGCQRRANLDPVMVKHVPWPGRLPRASGRIPSSTAARWPARQRRDRWPGCRERRRSGPRHGAPPRRAGSARRRRCSRS
jgi:hypothetical protein